MFEVQSLAAQEQEGLQKREALTARLNELEARERAGQEQVAALTAGTGKSPPGARRGEHGVDRKQGRPRVGRAARVVVPAAARRAGAAHPRTHAGRRAAQARMFLVHLRARSRRESEIQESRGQIERLQHEREQVSAQTAELIGRKNSQDGEISTREENLRAQRSRLTELQNSRGAVEVELAQKNMSRAEPARESAAEISPQPRRHPQRVHHHHLRRRRPGQGRDAHARTDGRQPARRPIGIPSQQQVEALQTEA